MKEKLKLELSKVEYKVEKVSIVYEINNTKKRKDKRGKAKSRKIKNNKYKSYNESKSEEYKREKYKAYKGGEGEEYNIVYEINDISKKKIRG